MLVTDNSTEFLVVIVIVSALFLMFNDTLRGGVDVASAKVKNLYSRASKTWGLSNFSDDELSEAEKSRNIRKFRNAHVGGLYNEGNTCFMNSVIQALASCDPVVDFCEQFKDDVNFSGGLGDIMENLNHLELRQHDYTTAKLIRQIGGAQRWSRYNQEDAQEFFQELLSTLEKDRKAVETSRKESAELGPESAAEPSVESMPIENEKQNKPDSKGLKLLTPFDGAFAVRVGCLQCGDMEGIRTGVLSSVDLNLGLDTNRVSLNKLLQDYTAMETIAGVECYRCTLNLYEAELMKKMAEIEAQNNKVLVSVFNKRIAEVKSVLNEKVIDDKVYARLKCPALKVQSDKSKQTMFAGPSADVLMIHINRSAFDLRSGIVRKNFAPVDFPVVFDLSQFVVDPQDSANFDPNYPMKGTASAPQNLYNLKAVVIHYGSANFGHYISFRKFHGLWWRISDDQVDLTTESQVLNAQGAFMLFYEKQGVSKRPEVPVPNPIVMEQESSENDENDDSSEDNANRSDNEKGLNTIKNSDADCESEDQ